MTDKVLFNTFLTTEIKNRIHHVFFERVFYRGFLITNSPKAVHRISSWQACPFRLAAGSRQKSTHNWSCKQPVIQSPSHPITQSPSHPITQPGKSLFSRPEKHKTDVVFFKNGHGHFTKRPWSFYKTAVVILQNGRGHFRKTWLCFH
jgi:hypothetical protein